MLVVAGAAALLLIVLAYFTAVALTRERPAVRAGTVHPTLTRESCIECHAPIAAEWRESFHFKSVTGPFWERVRRKGFADVFNALRVPCMNCHAPANVLDLAEGAHPTERTDSVDLGVDCVSCHVSNAGIVGSGRPTSVPHEVVRDDRFRDPVLASTAICARCHDEALEHAKTVKDWQRTRFARLGVTCLDCHMPIVESPSVQGGSASRRRSHRFLGDKDEGMLRRGLNASILLLDERRAVVRIINDRIGHSLPAAGTNWLIVNAEVRDETGRVVEEVEGAFGTREWIPGYLDFWPFLKVSKIPYGESRDITIRLPSGHGIVSARFSYRDWFAIKDRDLAFAEIVQAY